jgi:thiamine biosynthesis lipoprotein
MKETRSLMGMTIIVEIVDKHATQGSIEKVFEYLKYVDEKFSTYKDTSEISALNRGEIKIENASDDMREIFALAEKTKQETNGYFNIQKSDGSIDPSGIVKGWAIRNAAQILDKEGYKNFYVDIGGDVEVRGKNVDGKNWSIGIKNPFDENQIVKIVYLSDCGVATSGTYIRGQHIYNPHEAGPLEEVKSITVVGPDVYEADRFATAAFAMGKKGIYFIESLSGFEAYMIDKDGLGTATSGFGQYITKQ